MRWDSQRLSESFPFENENETLLRVPLIFYNLLENDAGMYKSVVKEQASGSMRPPNLQPDS